MAEPGPPTSLRRATAWSFAMSWGSRGIAALVTFVLAALLDPADFGIIGLAAVYIAFIQLFVEQGLTAALVQRKDLEEEHLDSTFWLVVVVSLLLAGLGVLLSDLWADAKDLPRLRPVILALSVQPLVAGLTVVPYSLLTRKLDFRALAIRASAAAAAGGAVGVTMALFGLGVWALVGQTLTRVVVELAILWAATDWRPRLRFSRSHLVDLLPFSAKTLAGTLGFFIGNWASTVVLGLFFGPVALGLFRFAERVMQMAADLISRPLGTVALPELSRRQADPEELGRSVLKLTRMVASLVLPAMVLIVVLSDRIVGIVGERWAPAADVLKLLCVVGVGGSLTRFTGPLLKAVSRPGIDAAMLWGFAVLNVAGFVGAALLLEGAGVARQALGIAAAYAALNALVYVPVSIFLTLRCARLSLGRLAAAVRPGAAAAVVAGLVAWGVGLAPPFGSLPPLVAAPALGALGGLAGLAVLWRLDPVIRGALHGRRRGPRPAEAAE